MFVISEEGSIRVKGKSEGRICKKVDWTRKYLAETSDQCEKVVTC